MNPEVCVFVSSPYVTHKLSSYVIASDIDDCTPMYLELVNLNCSLQTFVVNSMAFRYIHKSTQNVQLGMQLFKWHFMAYSSIEVTLTENLEVLIKKREYY